MESNATIEIRGGEVHKHLDRSISLSRATEKHRIVEAASFEGRFTTPRLIGHVEATNTLVLELVALGSKLSVVIQAALSDDRHLARALFAVETAAIGLSDIHAVEAQSHLVLQHGDFGINNIFLSEDNSLAIIDPLPNLVTSFDPLGFETRETDFGFFIGSIVRQMGFRGNYPAKVKTARHLVSAAFTAYEEASALKLDKTETSAIARQADLKIGKRHRSSQLSAAATNAWLAVMLRYSSEND